MELIKQYKLVQGSRNAVLNFLETMESEDLNKGVKEFNNTSIASLMIHAANTYINWLANFAMNKNESHFSRNSVKTTSYIRAAYAKSDSIVETFLDHFKDSLDTPLSNRVEEINRVITATPLELITHTITHEFHHKGQIMTISRLLGYTPPDADVIRFE